MNNKKIVVALGHNALGSTFPEQKAAVKKAAAAIAGHSPVARLIQGGQQHGGKNRNDRDYDQQFN